MSTYLNTKACVSKAKQSLSSMMIILCMDCVCTSNYLCRKYDCKLQWAKCLMQSPVNVVLYLHDQILLDKLQGKIFARCPYQSTTLSVAPPASLKQSSTISHRNPFCSCSLIFLSPLPDESWCKHIAIVLMPG
jgi:hypothetical protein